MTKLYDYFKEKYLNKSLVQSYLIGNTSYNDISEELSKVLSEFFFESEIKIENNTDIYILKNEDGQINKDQIVKLLKDISYTSQFNKIKIYIIDEFEKLNKNSVNSILKTLEEPQNNIYAFLITKNIDSIIDTIKSRCEKIFISSFYDKKNVYDEEIENIAIKFKNIVDKKNLITISEDYDVYKLLNDRNSFNSFLNCLLNLYYDEMNRIINDNYESNTIIQTIINKISIINDIINRNNSYMNKNLSIDRLIIEMWRCKNENS